MKIRWIVIGLVVALAAVTVVTLAGCPADQGAVDEPPPVPPPEMQDLDEPPVEPGDETADEAEQPDEAMEEDPGAADEQADETAEDLEPNIGGDGGGS